MPQFVVGSPVETQEEMVTVDQDESQHLSVGQHVFQLVVIDDAGNESVPAKVEVVVKDTQAPTAVLRAPSQVEFGKPFRLDGRESSDIPPGKIVKYIWTLVQ